MTLEPIEPQEAIELYLKDKAAECAESTMRGHRSRLRFFRRWCEEEGIDNMNDLTGRDMHRYRVWRRNQESPGGGTPNTTTMKTQMDTVRVFIDWAEKLQAVESGLSETVVSPSIAPGADERDVKLDSDVAHTILEYLEKYQYASREHVILTLIWRGLLRRGGVRAVDLQDIATDVDDPHIKVQHRPETGTPLKKHGAGERHVGITDATATIIEDWIETHRPDSRDEHGNREPLIATEHGRAHGQTIQSDAYAVTRPCHIGADCPHDRDPENCTAASNRHKAYECPSSRSPHAIRRGAITHWLSSDVPETVVSDRASTDPSVLSAHYDARSERQKQRQRRKYLDNV